MLVLSRKKNESIVIDGGIKLTIVEIRGDKVRLGIEAPQSVRVNRSEIHDAIQREPARSLKHDSGQASVDAASEAIELEPARA